MFKNVTFSDPSLKKLINENGYDTLIIEEIRWRSDWRGVCEPIIVGKLAGPLPPKEVLEKIQRKKPFVYFKNLQPCYN